MCLNPCRGRNDRRKPFVARFITTAVMVIAIGCDSHSDRIPTAPTASGPSATPPTIAVEVPSAATLSWSCATRQGAQNSSPRSAWTFAQESCPSLSYQTNATADRTVATSPIEAPKNLRATLNGSTVQLNWDSVPGACYAVHVGSAAGLSDLAVMKVSETSLTVSGVPSGVYFARVVALSPSLCQLGFGEFSFPSAEITVVVNDSCGGPLLPPSGLRSDVAGNNVSLYWTPPFGALVDSYVIVVDDVPTSRFVPPRNLLVYETIGAPTTVQAIGPIGVYSVRLHARNACGTSEPSEPTLVTIGPPPTLPLAVISGPGQQGWRGSTCSYRSCGVSAFESKGIGLTFFWDFGDGTTGTGIAPLKRYAPPASCMRLTVWLTVTDFLGRTNIASRDIQICPDY